MWFQEESQISIYQVRPLRLLHDISQSGYEVKQDIVLEKNGKVVGFSQPSEY